MRIENLNIQNYKGIQSLQLEAFSVVNLLTGKNNSGKSSVLEAVKIVGSSPHSLFPALREVLISRGENVPVRLEESFQSPIDSIFPNWDLNPESGLPVTLSARYPAKQNGKHTESTVILRPTLLIELTYESEPLDTPTLTRYIETTAAESPDAKNGMFIVNSDQGKLLPMKRINFLIGGYNNRNPDNHSQLMVHSSPNQGSMNAIFWDAITLTPLEEVVLDSLRIIEPRILGLAFVEDRPRTRIPVVRLHGSTKAVPLKSMGDGLNRILSIALALANSTGQILLIDEFENGLHHSTQQLLWEMILKIAKKYEIQVFATTHSEDCISAFGRALCQPEIEGLGALYRIEQKANHHRAVRFDAKEINIATEAEIEIR